MAGVCLGPDALTFLERFDRTVAVATVDATTCAPVASKSSSVLAPSGTGSPPLGLVARQLQSIDACSGKAQPFLRVHRVMSSWDALYFRLRANFDGLKSEYIPFPPPPLTLSTRSGKSKSDGKDDDCLQGDLEAEA